MNCYLCASNSIHFRHTNGCSWESVEPPTFRLMLNAVTYWAIRPRHLLSHVFEYWLWWCRYFLSKVNIWNVDRARATAFIFDTHALIWNLKVKFMGEVIGQGITVSPVPNWFTSFLLASIWPTIHDIQLFEIWLWKNQCHIIIIVVVVVIVIVIVIYYYHHHHYHIIFTFIVIVVIIVVIFIIIIVILLSLLLMLLLLLLLSLLFLFFGGCGVWGCGGGGCI